MGQAPAGGARRKKPVNLGAVPRLTARQRRFAAEYLKSTNATAAAVAAGYSPRSARAIGAQLLDGKTYPLVAAEVGRQLDARDRRALLDADGVLRYIHTAMLFCPTDYARPGGAGRWLTTPAEFDRWPPEVKCLVEEMEARAEERDGVRAETLSVKFVSKTAMTALAARHQLSGKTRMVVHQVNWEGMVRGVWQPPPDPIEEEIRAIEALPDPPDPTPGG